MTQTTQTPTFQPSQGHIVVLNGLEYFLRNGELYRASVANYIANDGYRVGARWQAPAHLVKSTLSTLGIEALQ
jgi:hypothetical protein